MSSAEPNIRCQCPDGHLAAGNNHFDNKKYDEAISAFFQHIAQHPGCAEAIFNLAALFEDINDPEKAASHFFEVAKQHPAHLPSWQRGLMALAKARQADAFADALVSFIKACEEQGLFWKWPYYMLQHACDHHMARDDREAAFAFFNATIGRSQQYARLHMCWFIFLFGGYFLRIGDVKNGVNCMKFASKELRFLVHACFGDEFGDRVASVPDEMLRRFDESIDFPDRETPDVAGSRCVVLSACDAVYFKRFGLLMALSVDLFSQERRIVHFHVVDADEACDALVSRLRALMRRTHIGYSRQPDFQDLPREDRITYFTCSRFMVADRVMQRYRLPLLIADVDGVFVDDPVLFTDQLSEEAPLALLYSPERLDALYNAVGGGLVGLYPTQRTAALLDLVKRYMLYWYERRQMVWFFDQLTWVHAVEDAKRREWNLPVTRLVMDRGRIALGAAKFFQVFEEKKESGFDQKLSQFLDEIGSRWASGTISPEEARSRYKSFFGLEDM